MCKLFGSYNKLDIRGEECQKSSMRDVVAVVATYPHFLSVAAVLTFSSPAIPSLHEEGFTDVDQLSWMAAIPGITQLIGAVIVAAIQDYSGRKLAMLLSAVPYSIGWTCICAAKSWFLIHLGQALGGIGVGMTKGAVGVYIVEIANPRRRGFLLAAGAFVASLGCLVVQTVGLFLNFRLLAIVCATFPLISVLAVLPLPESARWCITKGKDSEALESLRWLMRNDKEEIGTEFEAMQQHSSKTTKKLNIGDLRQGHIYKPLTLSIILLLCLIFCGYFVLNAYLQTIFIQSEINVGLIPAFLLTMNVGCFVSIFLYDKLGRRWPFILGGISITIGLTISGLCDYIILQLNTHSQIVSNINFTGFIFIGSGVSLSWNNVPHLLISEMVSLDFRAFAVALGTILQAVSSFLLIKLFPFMLKNFTFPGLMWFYAGFALFGTIVAFLFLKETKGKSLEDLENLYSD